MGFKVLFQDSIKWSVSPTLFDDISSGPWKGNFLRLFTINSFGVLRTGPVYSPIKVVETLLYALVEIQERREDLSRVQELCLSDPCFPFPFPLFPVSTYRLSCDRRRDSRYTKLTPLQRREWGSGPPNSHSFRLPPRTKIK